MAMMVSLERVPLHQAGTLSEYSTIESHEALCQPERGFFHTRHVLNQSSLLLANCLCKSGKGRDLELCCVVSLR